MAIVLDGELIKIEKSKSNPIINEMQEIYEALDKRFGLAQGEQMNLVFNPQFYTGRVEVYDERENLVGSKMLVPSGLSAPYTANFTDADGHTHQITYYEQKRFDRNLQADVYTPVDMDFRGSLSFSRQDKEKLIFSYLFNPYIKCDIVLRNINPFNEKTNNLVFEDIRAEAIKALTIEDRWFETYTIFKSMDENQVRQFAYAAGIESNVNKDLTEVKSAVTAMLRRKPELESLMKKFAKSKGDEPYVGDLQLKILVEQAMERRIIAAYPWTQGKKCNWYFGDKETGEKIVVLEGAEIDVDKFIVFLKNNEEWIEKIK